MSATYPFSAIVGQEEMRRALMCVAVDPSLGGVLVFGDRGTGKSTTIRALAELLPKISVRPSCAFRCDPDTPTPNCENCPAFNEKSKQLPMPVVDLPLGVTEDRVVGSLNIEDALLEGKKSFQPGLLASAHRGFLYVDEVNLLEDHIVDLLLDVAASGENVVEREGISLRHAAKFVLIGSGNPEEGELRPQLLDRFGLCTNVGTPEAVDERVEIIKRRDAFEREPQTFAKKYARRQSTLRSQLRRAQENVADIPVSDEVLQLISQLCVNLGCDGLRGELTLMRAARAWAALQDDTAVERAHVVTMAAAALSHRLRRDPLDESDGHVRVERAIAELCE